MKAEQPRNLGYLQLAIVEVTNRQIASELLKYLTVPDPVNRRCDSRCIEKIEHFGFVLPDMQL